MGSDLTDKGTRVAHMCILGPRFPEICFLLSTREGRMVQHGDESDLAEGIGYLKMSNNGLGVAPSS